MECVCIKCGERWEKEEGNKNDITGSLCMDCLIELLINVYRKEQKRNGYPDCFYKSLGNCERTWCLYYKLCVHKQLHKTV